MKYGCRAHDYGCKTAADLAKTLHSRGYNACQLAPAKAILGVGSYFDLNPDLCEEIRSAFDEQKVQISVLGCYMDLSNPDKEARMQGVSAISKALELQKSLGGICVGTETSWENLPAELSDKKVPYMMDSILRIMESAAKYDAVFALEPVYRHPLRTPEMMQKVLDTVADPVHLKLIFDPVNVLKASDIPNLESYMNDWLSVMGDHITAMHIKGVDFDSVGNQVATPLTEGVMNYSPIRKWLSTCPREIALLREEVLLNRDVEELDFLKALA